MAETFNVLVSHVQPVKDEVVENLHYIKTSEKPFKAINTEPEPFIITNPYKNQETMPNAADIAYMLGGQYSDLMTIISTPAFMPSTGTKGKRHVNRYKLSRKLRKKHRKAARNR